MATNSSLKPVRVEITADADGLHVCPIWPGVDRPNVGGYMLNDGQGKLAGRLAEAYLSGAAYGEAKIMKDIDGKTFVSSQARCMGRTLNADLKKIGY